MASNDDKALDLLPTPPKEATVSWLRDQINTVLKKLYADLHILEGRSGTIALRSPITVAGGIAVGTTYDDTVVKPTNGLIVEGEVGLQTADPKTDLHLRTTQSGLYVDSNIGTPTFLGRRQNASYTAPDNVLTDDGLARFGGTGYADTGFATGFRGQFGVIATENWTDTANGTKLVFMVTPAGTITPATILELREGDLFLNGPSFTIQTTSNGAQWKHGYNTELVTIAAAATSDSAANLLPADSIIEAVVIRVTVAPPGTASFRLGDAANTARFIAAGTSTAVNTTAIGLQHWRGSVAADNAGPSQIGAAAAVRIQPNAVPSDATGRIRVTVFYRSFVAPTS